MVLANWVEALTSATGYATVPSSSSSSSYSLPQFPALPMGVAGMHPSVSVDQLTLPVHKKKRKGKEAQARQRGKGEAAQKKTKISASQQ